LSVQEFVFWLLTAQIIQAKKKKTQLERQEGKKKTNMMWNGRM
jgi:hypothetical protein